MANISSSNSSSNYSTLMGTLSNISTQLLDDDGNATYGDDTWSSSDYSDGAVGMTATGRAIHRVILPIICACGILGILLTVVVLSHKNMCTSTNCYLMALAIADLLYLLLLATILADNQFTPDTRASYLYMIYATYAGIFMHTFMLASIWLTVMLAVERYIAICHPFLAAKVCSVNRCRVLIVAIFVLAFLCRVPNFWEYKLMSAYDHNSGQTIRWLDMTSFYHNSAYVSVYPWVIDVAVTSVIPFILLLGLNVLLIWEVRKSTRYIKRNLVSTRSSSSVVQREEVQITIMLISVIMVFFICQAPYVIYSAMYSINKAQSSSLASSSAFMLFRFITWLLLTLKSAINFILYCWFSEKFWATLKRIVCVEKCLVRMNKNSQSGSYYTLRRYSSCTTRDTCI